MTMDRIVPRLPILRGLLAAAMLLLILSVANAGTSAAGDLRFFRATEDSAQYAKDPRRYDRVSFSPPERIGALYIERQPTLRIALADIKSVMIEKEKVYKNLQEGVLEALGEKKKDANEAGAEYYYVAAFTLSPKASRQVATLSRRHHGELFDLRLGSRRLSIGRFTGPSADNTFNPFRFPLMENDRQRIQEILSPLKGRVTWK